MTKDYMKSATKMDFTAYDIGCGCYTPKHQTQLKKIFRRKARRNLKKALDKCL